MSNESTPRRRVTDLVVVALIFPTVLVVLTSLSSEPVEAGWWEPRILVTDDPGDSEYSEGSAVAMDKFGNVHVVWNDEDLDGSGPDGDIFYRKWNATTDLWESRVLVTDDNLNNVYYSGLPDVETDIFGNVHVVWD